jgi:diaminopimelate decarboxylase
VNADDIARRFGTPAYVYDLTEIRRACQELRATLPRPHRLYYSVKANPHSAVAGTLAGAGCHAEISSTGELAAALAAGFPPERLLMTGPGKTATDIAAAVDAGVRRFSAESEADLDRIEAATTSAECLLRINADRPVAGMGLAMTGTSSQFGTDLSTVAAAPERFRGRITGLHLYMGTNIADEDTLLRQYEQSITIAAELGFELSELDLGGGFGAPYSAPGDRYTFPGLRARLSALLDAHLPGWRDGRPGVSFESGRYLTGTCGRLITRVVDVKTSKGKTYAVLDSGVHHLGGMAGLRRLPRLQPRPLVGTGRQAQPYTLVGPLCTPLDTWAQGVTLPGLAPGDLLEIPNVGAYGLTASLLGFLGHPAPVEVVLDGDEPVEASRLALHRTPIPASRSTKEYVR